MLWAGYAFDLVYEVEKIICISLDSICDSPYFVRYFHMENTRCADAGNSPAGAPKTDPPRNRAESKTFKTFQDTNMGMVTVLFYITAQWSEPFLADLFSTVCFQFGLFPVLIHHCSENLLILINCGCPIPGRVQSQIGWGPK